MKKTFDVYSTGKDNSEVINAYQNWASTYDQDLSSEWYNGPAVASEVVSRYFPSNRESVEVLDVAAGTGILGEKIKSYGFSNIDAIDPSDCMLEIAKSKNVYRHFFCESVSQDNTSIHEDTYDCVACSGGFGQGHIPIGALYEMIRIVKPGGVIIIVLREEFLECLEYKDKLEPLMKNLEEEKKWENLEKYQFPNYVFSKTGLVFIFRVL